MIREYFQTGILPEEGTICEPETLPFLGGTKENKGLIGDCVFSGGSDTTLWEGLVELADPFKLKLESNATSFGFYDSHIRL